MVTFFGILMVLISINALLFFFSVNKKNKVQKSTKSFSEVSSASRIYPMNYSEVKYKKAV
jgi:hypothetical protein